MSLYLDASSRAAWRRGGSQHRRARPSRVSGVPLPTEIMKAFLFTAALTALSIPTSAQNTFSPDEQGFIRNWLVLAPIAMNGQSGADEINYDFLKGEATIRRNPTRR